MNQLLSSFALVLLFVISLTSCAPMHKEYYTPITQGEYSSPTCGGGPKNKITIELINKIRLNAHIKLTTYNELLPYIVLEVPANSNIKLSSNKVKFISNKHNQALYINKIRAITPRHFFDMDSTEVMQGNTVTHTTIWRKFKTYNEFTMHFNKLKTATSIKEFTLQLPNALINSIPFKIPALRFKKESGVYIYALNC